MVLRTRHIHWVREIFNLGHLINLGYCNCNQGQQYFWNSTQDSLPLDSYRDYTLAQSLDSNQPNGCADICVCDINGVCYKPEDSMNYNIDLVPYCNSKYLVKFVKFLRFLLRSTYLLFPPKAQQISTRSSRSVSWSKRYQASEF
jgi:hypothetical protein